MASLHKRFELLRPEFSFQRAAPTSMEDCGGFASPFKWSDASLRKYYRAFHKHGAKWNKVSKAVGTGKSAGQCESLHQQHQTFLGIPSQPQLEDAFVAMVADHVKNVGADNEEKPGSDTVSDSEERPAASEAPVPGSAKRSVRDEKHGDKADFFSPDAPTHGSPHSKLSSQKKRARRLFTGEEGGDDAFGFDHYWKGVWGG
eukprot:gene10022-7912_t